VDWFDRQILQYVLRWAPFGKPPEEDVYPNFGMNIYQLTDRFADIVKTMNSRKHQLDPNDTDLLAKARSHPMARPRPRETTPNPRALHTRSGM
jgi:hypothetical protein